MSRPTETSWGESKSEEERGNPRQREEVSISDGRQEEGNEDTTEREEGT